MDNKKSIVDKMITKKEITAMELHLKKWAKKYDEKQKKIV